MPEFQQAILLNKTTRMMENTNTQFKLLIVDDEELTRNMTAFQLSDLGYEIIEVSDGPGALALIREKNFDLILLDISMPVMNGLEVLEKIRLNNSALNLPIIMVTAEDQADSIVSALDKGANDYLVKPLNIQVAHARIKTQLSHSGLVQLKDEFLRFASHDLKKPLMVTEDIVSELKSNLGKELPDKEDALLLLDMLAKTNGVMQGLIRGFLDGNSLITANGNNEDQAININSLVLEIINTNSNYAHKKNIKLHSEFDDEIPIVQSDPFCISRIIENLLGNAIKFSPHDTITTVYTKKKNGAIFVEVSDTGPGLTNEDMKLLFQDNVQLSNKPTGNEESSNIGLPLCKKLVQQINGKIGAHNNNDKGSTFWISVPVL